jgi:hypothetical protein
LIRGQPAQFHADLHESFDDGPTGEVF